VEWTDEAIVLSAARLGDSDAVLEVMTPHHGRARGFIKGGLGRRNKANLQPGNQLAVTWRSRLETNLGRFTVELVHSPLGLMLGDGSRLAALSAVTATVASTMNERELHEGVYAGLKVVLDLLEHDSSGMQDWAAALTKLELGILSAVGFGLDLSECASTGTKENLIYVSPKSGRAVSGEAGMPYKGRLLDLPAFVASGAVSAPSLDDVINGLKLTGYFLERNIWIVHGKGQPAARERLFSSLLATVQPHP